MTDPHAVTTMETLESLYGEVQKTSQIKEIDYISDHYRAFIEAAPFVVIASVGEEGLDCSPRGDPAGFVRVSDEKTVQIPDRRGNNRIDTLRNIVRDPRISLLFLIPGIGETLRINGRAEITRDPALCETFAINGKAPVTVLNVSVDRVYFQCQKALVRSRLWAPETQIERTSLPSTGTIVKALDNTFDAAAYDANYPERLKKTIY
ncbi:pyridoxamine 5'-phosphate oxidase family protein [Breoghania sp.]|uniref:pyridoxamine 5'-phosphate oxidase family protein n=1 Tax=Breoghania sp. TaxID=2065378 RepID=UPI002AA68EE3|nr:pyridoxamine 5'-phosphate oxidase family protein [Breoghania sp.]